MSNNVTNAFKFLAQHDGAMITPERFTPRDHMSFTYSNGAEMTLHDAFVLDALHEAKEVSRTFESLRKEGIQVLTPQPDIAEKLQSHFFSNDVPGNRNWFDRWFDLQIEWGLPAMYSLPKKTKNEIHIANLILATDSIISTYIHAHNLAHFNKLYASPSSKVQEKGCGLGDNK